MSFLSRVNAKRNRLVLIVLAALLLLAAVTQLPAYQAYRWLGVDEQLVLRGLTGTVWRGQADQLVVRDYPLGALKWQLSPLKLLLFELSVNLQVEGPDGKATGLLSRPLFGGSIELSALAASLPASWLQLVLQEPLFQLRGQLEVQIQELILAEDGSIDELQGQVIWQQAAVAGDFVTALGELQLDWHSEAGALVGELNDNGGPLALTGEVRIVNGQYQVAARLAARGDNQPLRRALQVLGRPDAEGWLALNISGPMIPIGELLE